MKWILYMTIAVLLASVGLATTGVDVKVECGEGWFNSDICRDFELQDEFDTVTDYIKTNEETWSTDVKGGGGIGRDTLGRELMGDSMFFHKNKVTFYEFLADEFVSQDVFEEVLFRLDKIEAMISGYDAETSLHYALMKQSERLQQTVSYMGFKCDSMSCIQVN